MQFNDGIKLTPAKVFQLVSLLPKELQDQFREQTRVEVKNSEIDFDPEPTYKYDHSLGLGWLTDHKIPNTQEALNDERAYIFQTMVSGPVTYNVGQFIVLFPEIVYGTRDITDELLIVEVMDELEFPPELDLRAKDTDELRAVDPDQLPTIALQAALRAYLPAGKIKIHTAGFRMYHRSERYAFEDNFSTAPTLNFKESAKRNR